jgi:diaminopimelate epimerase
MQDTIEFVKLSGSGNDFVCLDNRGGRFDPLLREPPRVARFARTLCRRGLGVGADGVIFACPVEDGVDADIAARFLEADGSEAELCGNGTAVFVHWAAANRWFDHAEIRVLTQAGVVRGHPVAEAPGGNPDSPAGPDGSYVRVCIPLPHELRLGEELRAGRRNWSYDYVVTGVPHAVAYVPDVEGLDVGRWGPAFRHHKRFAPRGVNANFVQVLGEGRLAIRTFEFGVEGETLACGTGCAAAAILATIRYRWPDAIRRGDQPVLLQTRSGDVLRVYLTLAADNSVTDLCLDTRVRFAFRGELHPQLVEEAVGPQGP